MNDVRSVSIMCAVVAVVGCGGMGIFPSITDCSQVQCGPCAPALTLTVRTPQGQAVPGVVVTGEEASCAESEDGTQCLFVATGELSFDVSAPGFQSAHVETEVPVVETEGCCGCGYESQTRTIVLQPS